MWVHVLGREIKTKGKELRSLSLQALFGIPCVYHLLVLPILYSYCASIGYGPTHVSCVCGVLVAKLLLEELGVLECTRADLELIRGHWSIGGAQRADLELEGGAWSIGIVQASISLL